MRLCLHSSSLMCGFNILFAKLKQAKAYNKVITVTGCPSTVPMILKWRFSQNGAKIHPNELWSVWITMVVLVFWLVWSFMTNFEFEKFLSNGFFSEFVSKFQTCFSYLYRTTSLTSCTPKWSSSFPLFTVWRNPGGTWWQWSFLAFENSFLVQFSPLDGSTGDFLES